MNKLTLIALVVLAVAGVAAANTNSKVKQCTPEPITMLALIPGAAMLIRRRNKKA
jgi:hypothetical protein